MTAFHILALSSRPEIILFRTLQAYCPRRLMEVPDGMGVRPIDYMSSNSTIPMSERKRLVEYLLEATVIHRAHKLRLAKWRVAVSKAVANETTTLLDDVGINKIYRVLERYELIEMLSSLELRIWYWKLKMSHKKGSEDTSDRQPKRMKLDEREFARVNCGADIVIGNVLPFLRAPP
mmetsp:Transcript_18581/g.46013  ORF Transcript_18581/g.46013 Transcript_18581/m.46013 type:complete len:177 (+) Transcript_18581:1010-1540(+)